MTVLDGAKVWALSATHGLPLEFVLADLADHDCVPAWDQFARAARRDGTNMPRLLARVQDAVTDAYPPEVAQVIVDRLPSVWG